MTDKEFAIELIRRLQSVDDTCMTCARNPKTDVCTDIANTEICYKGIKAFMEKGRVDRPAAAHAYVTNEGFFMEDYNGKTPKD